MAIKPVQPIQREEVRTSNKEEVLAEREILKETLKDQEVKKDKHKNFER